MELINPVNQSEKWKLVGRVFDLLLLTSLCAFLLI